MQTAQGIVFITSRRVKSAVNLEHLNLLAQGICFAQRGRSIQAGRDVVHNAVTETDCLGRGIAPVLLAVNDELVTGRIGIDAVVDNALAVHDAGIIRVVIHGRFFLGNHVFSVHPEQSGFRALAVSRS